MWKETGFHTSAINITGAIHRLSIYIDKIPEHFQKFTLEELLNKPAAKKWSKKEILGHLIDSAINNLKRFTDIQFLLQPYIVQSYHQDNLVAANNYQQLSLDHLLSLWQSLNRQIIFVVNQIPPEKLSYPVDPQYDKHEMKTLGWLICDYVAHMEHHMKQIGAVEIIVADKQHL